MNKLLRTIALGASTRVAIRFDHPVEMRRVKVRATSGVRVTGPGIDFTAGAAWRNLST